MSGGMQGIGIEKREARQDGKVAWHSAMGPGQGRKLARDQLERLMEGCKSSVRARWDTCFSMWSRCLAPARWATKPGEG